MLKFYSNLSEEIVRPMEFLLSKEGFTSNLKVEEGSNFATRTGAAFLSIPVTVITAIALSVLSVLSLLPLALLKIVGSESCEPLKRRIQKNNISIINGLIVIIASIANVFTLTFYRKEIFRKTIPCVNWVGRLLETIKIFPKNAFN